MQMVHLVFPFGRRSANNEIPEKKVQKTVSLTFELKFSFTILTVLLRLLRGFDGVF